MPEKNQIPQQANRWQRVNVAVRRWWCFLQNHPQKNMAASSTVSIATQEVLPCASVIIPALNEAGRITDVIAHALADPATAEVIVVDDSSTDDTVALAQEAGATVITSRMLGKGASMQDGVIHAKSEFLVYLDGDLCGLQRGIVSDLCQPLLQDSADFVKASFGRAAGRVTELTAKPMLKMFFPELSMFHQPLGGIIAARKRLLQALPFEEGYGVDIGLLVDAHLAGARLAQVEIGSLAHDSQPLHDLGLMANEISHVIFSRAKAAGRLHAQQITAMTESQRQAASGIDYVLMRRKGRERLLLLDMDGTITPTRYVLELARASGHEAALSMLLDEQDDAATRSQRIAKLFQYVHQKKFEQVAHALPIRSGVLEFVKAMRQRGFMVGVVSDSYFIAADIMRRRIFADFALAHTISFDNGVCDGKLCINPAFVAKDSGQEVCKSHVLRRFLQDNATPPVTQTWAIGDNINDLALLRMADQSFAIAPKFPLLQAAGITIIDSFSELLDLLQAQENIAPVTA